jgi:small subunit ribosomal protein S17
MPRRILEGEVVSDKMEKTITVLVQRRYMHPVYKKYVNRSDKYAAHDGANRFKVGDKVQIIECAPISKRKRWTVLVDGQIPAEAPSEKKAASAAAKKPAAPKKEAAEKKPAAAKKTTAKKKDA